MKIVNRIEDTVEVRIFSLYTTGLRNSSGKRTEDCFPSQCSENLAVVFSARRLQSVISGRPFFFCHTRMEAEELGDGVEEQTLFLPTPSFMASAEGG